MNTRNNWKRWIIPVLVCIIIIGIWAYFSYYHFFDDDEFQHTHMSWLIWHGFIPYRDFFEHHSPLYHILFSPVFSLGSFAGLIFIFRAVSFLCGAGTLLTVYLFCHREYAQKTAIMAVLLLALVPMFLFKMLEARPESPAIFLFTIVSASLLGKRESAEKNTFFMVGAGFLTGIFVLLSQKYVFAAFGIFSCVFIMYRFRSSLLFAGGVFLSCIPLFLWLSAHGLLYDFYRSTIVLNIGWKHSFSPAGYLNEAFLTGGTLFSLGILGFMKGMAEKTPEFKKSAGALCIFSGGLLGIFVIPEPYRQVFLPIFPILTIGACAILHMLWRAFGKTKAVSAALTVSVVAALLPAFVRLSGEYNQTNTADIETMKQVEKMRGKHTPVFDGRGLMFYRMHLGRHACMHEGIMMMIDPDKFAGDLIEELQRNRDVIIILDYRVKKMPVGILNLVRKHYQRIDGTDIFVPGFSLDRSELLDAGSELMIEIPGWYRINWIGEGVLIDKQETEKNSEVFFDRGLHYIKITGFVDKLTIMLVRKG